MNGSIFKICRSIVFVLETILTNELNIIAQKQYNHVLRLLYIRELFCKLFIIDETIMK